ncbi:MAG: DUF502 domain-containing protein [Flavobacteriaceae bacterium]
MKTIWKFIKTTVIGGLLFLVPVVVLIVILIQAYGLMLKVAQPLEELIPIDEIGGVAIANIIVILLILLICFIAGLLATGGLFKRIQHNLEHKLLLKIPGYGFIKGITNSMKKGQEASEHFLPVLIHFEEFEQIGFEIERAKSGKVVVYLPGSPNPWSGVIIYLDAERVESIDISVPDAISHMEQLGMGSDKIFKKA